MKFDFSHLVGSGRYAQWFSIGLIILFSLLILLEWASLRFSFITTPPLTTAVSTAVTKTQEDNFQAALNSSLFGVYVPKNINEASIKKSMLNVSLVGILYTGSMSESQVIIRSASGEEKTYRLEDKIPGDAVIKRITANGILVEHHGTLESLSLPKNELNFEPKATPLKEE